MKYAIIFDMDETLGFFQQINYIWHLIKNINEERSNQNINNNIFINIFDLYPEFIRPNIFKILEYLKIKKQNNKCSNVIIYTNNKTSKEWVQIIQNYFNHKLKFNLFDKIICAYKINNIIIENKRNSVDKTFDDLISCTQIDQNSKICFIDDKFYPKMIKNNLIYIKLKQYIYQLDKQVIFNRLNQSKLINKNILIQLFNKYNYINNYKNENVDIHNIIGKKLLQHLNKFFSSNITIKKKIYNNKTKKFIKNI